VGGQQNPMGSMFMPMMVLLIVMVVYRFAADYIGYGMNYVLYPLIGFGGEMPLMTLFAAAMIFPIISRLIIFFTTDWVGQARNRHIMKHYQKELKDATQTNNRYKMKKLQEMQPKIMEMQGAGMSMKTMIIPMLVILPIFAWLRYFLETLSVMPIGALPWAYVNLSSVGTAFPNWILIYMLITFPFYAVLEKGIKLIFWNKEFSARGTDASRDSW